MLHESEWRTTTRRYLILCSSICSSGPREEQVVGVLRELHKQKTHLYKINFLISFNLHQSPNDNGHIASNPGTLNYVVSRNGCLGLPDKSYSLVDPTGPQWTGIIFPVSLTILVVRPTRCERPKPLAGIGILLSYCCHTSAHR